MPADHDHSGERDADLDAAFAEIIAGWDDDVSGPVRCWPASEDVDDGPGPTSMEQLRLERDRTTADADPDADADADERAVPPVDRVTPVTPVGPLAGSAEPGPHDWEVAAHPDEHFEPPDPPPLPRGDLVSQLAWAGLILGPTFLLFAGLFWRDVGPLWLAVAAAAFVGGFVALVVRMPHSRGEDDDDGAVV